MQVNKEVWNHKLILVNILRKAVKGLLPCVGENKQEILQEALDFLEQTGVLLQTQPWAARRQATVWSSV